MFIYTQNKANPKAVDILIYGEIGYDNEWSDRGTNNHAFPVVSKIKELEKQYNRINVHINSQGGDINEGLAIYNALKDSSAEIHTYNDGLAASMAGIIMLAGTAHAPVASIHHVHSASAVVWGNKNDFQQAIDALITYEDALKQIIASKTGISNDEVAKYFDGKDYFFTAQQAKELGFIDIVEQESKAQVPKNINNLNYKAICNLYAAKYPATAEKQKEGIINKAFTFFNHKQANNKSNMKTIKSGLAFLLAALAMTEFQLDDSNNPVVSLEDLFALNEHISKLQSQLDAANQLAETRKTESEALQNRVNELNEAAKNTPQNHQNPKSDPKDDAPISFEQRKEIINLSRNYLR